MGVRPAGAERQQLLGAIESAFGAENTEVDAHLVGSSIDPELHRMFERVQEIDASDLHLAAGQPPLVRVLGDLHRLTDFEVLSASRIRELVYSIISKRQQQQFETMHELDTNYTVPGIARYRVNVYLKRNGVAASFRQIPYTVRPFEELGLPESIRHLSELPRGLVLVTGPTGSGKSTTLASIIDLVNQHRPCHIITIEEPIEFVHDSKMALVSQRDVGSDTESFATALRQALRQDPDVILVGEMRDLETISTAVTAAETGHLVFATLHTQDAAQTIDRIVDAFPAEQQGQVRIQVASTLQGIVTQQLVPTADGTAACGRGRGAHRHAGDPQPHPRRQDPPGLPDAASRAEVRHEHDGRAPRCPRARGADHDGRRHAALPRRQRAEASGRGRGQRVTAAGRRPARRLPGRHPEDAQAGDGGARRDREPAYHRLVARRHRRGARAP